MPRKQVYGKRATATSAFTLSTLFSSRSSPTKQTSPSNNDQIDDATAKLGSLCLTDDIRSKAERPKTRRVLSLKDGNIGRPKKAAKEKSKEIDFPKYTAKPEAISGPGLSPVELIKPANAVLTNLAGRPISPSRSKKEVNSDPFIQPLLELSTNRHSSQSFSSWSQTLEPYFSISKIAEASYGEVYRLSLSTPHATFTSTDESVLKILALKPAEDPAVRKKAKAQMQREENMSSIPSVLSEVKLLKRMTEVPGFTNYRALHVLQGRPSRSFIAAWKAWNKSRPAGEKSAFPDPSRKANYSDEQLWAVIEMQDAGTDVEKLQQLDDESLGTVEGVWDVFWQVALAVGKGEELARFEHRDLHLGNICVKRKVDYGEGKRGKGNARKLGFTDLETTIIDYTLSRAEMRRAVAVRPGSPYSIDSTPSRSCSSPSSSPSTEEQEIAYLDLATLPYLFTGDATEEYQYDVYRFMRNAMYFSEPLQDYSTHAAEAKDMGRSWFGFHPQTNLVWLHFVLRKLMAGLVDVDVDQELDCCEISKARKDELKATLCKVEGLLDLTAFSKNGLASARDLIAIALAEEWLDEEDVVGEAAASVLFETLDMARTSSENKGR